MNHNRIIVLAMVLMFAGSLFACGTSTTPITTTNPTIAPTSTVMPTNTPGGFYLQTTLTSTSAEEKGSQPNYQMTIQTPMLSGSDDLRIKKFNYEANEIIVGAVSDFQDNLTQAPTIPNSVGSSFDVKYESILPPGKIFSLEFVNMVYVSGGAR